MGHSIKTSKFDSRRTRLKRSFLLFVLPEVNRLFSFYAFNFKIECIYQQKSEKLYPAS